MSARVRSMYSTFSCCTAGRCCKDVTEYGHHASCPPRRSRGRSPTPAERDGVAFVDDAHSQYKGRPIRLRQLTAPVAYCFREQGIVPLHTLAAKRLLPRRPPSRLPVPSRGCAAMVVPDVGVFRDALLEAGVRSTRSALPGSPALFAVGGRFAGPADATSLVVVPPYRFTTVTCRGCRPSGSCC